MSVNAEEISQLKKQISDAAEQVEYTQKEMSEMLAKVHKQAQTKKAMLEDAQTRLQQAINLVIETKGQIAELTDRLEETERDRHRLEGAIDTLRTISE